MHNYFNNYLIIYVWYFKKKVKKLQCLINHKLHILIKVKLLKNLIKNYKKIQLLYYQKDIKKLLIELLILYPKLVKKIKMDLIYHIFVY